MKTKPKSTCTSHFLPFSCLANAFGNLEQLNGERFTLGLERDPTEVFLNEGINQLGAHEPQAQPVVVGDTD